MPIPSALALIVYIFPEPKEQALAISIFGGFAALGNILGVLIGAFFVVTTYIALDVGFSFTSVFGPSNPLQDLNSVSLFVLTTIWPGAAALIYFGLMMYIVLGVLNEVKPTGFYILAAVLFVLSQLDYFLLNRVICNVRLTRPPHCLPLT